MVFLPPPGIIGGGGTPAPAPSIPTPLQSTWNNWFLFAGGNTSNPHSVFLRNGYLTLTFQKNTASTEDFLFISFSMWLNSVQLYPTGDLLTAVQAAGSGHSVVGVQQAAGNRYAFIYNTGVSPRAWYIELANGLYIPATGLAAGNGLDMAGGLQIPHALVSQTGPASRFASDGFTYGTAGVPPSQVNRLVHERGQSGVYLGAAVGGVVKTINNGANWGYVRPHAGLGTLWPAGAVGRDIAFLPAPRNNPALAPLFVLGTTKYQKLGDENIWEDVDGAPPATTGRRLRYYGNGKMLHQTGTNGQIRISTNSGVTWVTRALPASVETITGYDVGPDGRIWVMGIAVSGADTGYIYYSDDNGANWTLSTSFSIDTQGGGIAVSPQNSNRVIAIYGVASSNIQAKVTQNGGTSWSTVTVLASAVTLDNAASGAAHWLGDRIVVTLQEAANGNARALYSDDFGTNWTSTLNIDTGTTTSGHIGQFISGGIFGPLFIALNYSVQQNTSRILRSVDQGETWDQLSIP